MIFLFITLCKPSVVNPNNLSSILTYFEKNSFGIEREDKGISGVDEIKEKLDMAKNMLNKSLEIGKTVFNSSNEISKNKQKHQLFKYNTSRKFSFNQRLESGYQKKNLYNVPSLKIYDADKTNRKSKKDKKSRKKLSTSQVYIESSNYFAIESKYDPSFKTISKKTTEEVSQPSVLYKKEISTMSTTEKENENASKSSIVQKIVDSNLSTTKNDGIDIKKSFIIDAFKINASFFTETTSTNDNDKSNKIKTNDNFIVTSLNENNVKFVGRISLMIENYQKLENSLSYFFECKIFNEFEVTILMLNILNKKTGLFEYVHNRLFNDSKNSFKYITYVDIFFEFCKAVVNNQVNIENNHQDVMIQIIKKNAPFFQQIKTILEELEEMKKFDFITYYDNAIVKYAALSDEVLQKKAQTLDRTCFKNINDNIKLMGILPDSTYFEIENKKEDFLNRVLAQLTTPKAVEFINEFKKNSNKLENKYRVDLDFWSYNINTDVILYMLKRLTIMHTSSLDKEYFYLNRKNCAELLQEPIDTPHKKIMCHMAYITNNDLYASNCDYPSLKSYDYNNMENYKNLKILSTYYPYILSTTFFLFSFCYFIWIYLVNR